MPPRTDSPPGYSDLLTVFIFILFSFFWVLVFITVFYFLPFQFFFLIFSFSLLQSFFEFWQFLHLTVFLFSVSLISFFFQTSGTPSDWLHGYSDLLTVFYFYSFQFFLVLVFITVFYFLPFQFFFLIFSFSLLQSFFEFCQFLHLTVFLFSVSLVSFFF